MAISDINLTLEKGSSLGLVGPSGGGKSTLVDIILGLLEPASGRVNVDGTDIASAPRSWQQRCGYVPQTIYLIDDTLRRNVALGFEDDEIDEGQIENAIHLSRLEDMVRDLPQGLDTNVGEQGVRLSGGQRQRVGIARALYRDPEVLVFDEATSSLDSETEHEINTAIERLSGKKTLIIIAHRLSTVRQCRHLAFLDKGRVSDMGTFDELTGRNDTFRNMVELSKL
jgi:ATP-binding cassette subfamily C protein